MDEIDVPSHFLCPISLELMRDPVTLSTGITYDRESIERWLFSCNNNTCPITKMTVTDSDLTPNHTLRRLIQAWCTLHSSFGVERIPTPKAPVDKTQIVKLLNEAKKSTNLQLKCLRRLRSIAFENERNRSSLEAAGAIEFLASMVKTDDLRISETAIEVLSNLKLSEAHIKSLLRNNSIEFVDSLVQVLRHGNWQSRAYATMLLKSCFQVTDPNQMIGVKTELFVEVIRVINDQISLQASKDAMKIIVELCPWGRNKIKAVEAGAVFVLVELLVDTLDRRTCELTLVVLDQICGHAEGRAEFLKHGAGVAIVSKKILRVSHIASDRGVRILSSICKYSGTSKVLQEMLQIGAVAKLCLVLQMDGSSKTKERAKEILKLHSRTWKNTSCIPPHLLSSYPS